MRPRPRRVRTPARPAGRPGKGRTDRGSATLLAVTLSGALTVVVMLALAAGSVVVDHRRVQAAADLAALAGAAALLDGRDGCGAADRLARANGAELRSCVTAVTTVLVEVAVETRFAGLTGEVSARARAGPAG